MPDDDEFFVEETIPVTDESLASIAVLGDKFVKLSVQIKTLQEMLEKKQKEFNYVEQVLMPEAMDSVKMRSFELASGITIEVEPVLKISYPPGTIDAVEKWLDDHEHSGMVKRQIIAAVPRDVDYEVIKAIISFIKKQKLSVKDNKSIHWQTLNAWAREMENNGQVIPEDIFNVYRARKAKISV
jgi:phage terminase large subunit-like protein